jgi:hypothetical protein
MLIEPKFLRRQPGIEGYQFADVFELSDEDQTHVYELYGQYCW